MNFGFLARCTEAGATLVQFGDPPDSAADLLSHAADAEGWAVFLGQLYYHADLRRRLASTHQLESTASPAEHVLATYRHGGPAALDWLEGDYAYAVWDTRRRRLLAGRDPFGGFPLFWIREGNAIVLATAMPPLLDLLPSRTINRDYLADYLLMRGNGVQELNDERCAYEHVHRVLAGTRIEVRPGGSVQAARWWNWLDRVEPPPSLRLEDLAQHFRALLEESIRQRRVGRVAAHLSGGMDSTAVALLAARQARSADEEPVHALSMVYDRFPLLAYEGRYIDSALGEAGLVAHRLPGEDYLDFGGYRYDLSPDEPVLALWQATAVHGPVEYSAKLGARTLMTGLGGDEAASESTYLLHDQLRRGRWLAAWRDSARWASVSGTSRWHFLGYYGLVPFLPSAWQAGFQCWWHGGRVPWQRQGQHTIAPFILPEFAQRFRMWDRAVAQIRRAAHHGGSLAMSMNLEMNELNIGDVFRWEVGVPRGVMIVHPYRDPRLVCFSLGWQDRALIDPARQKPVLAEATRDVLPALIRDRLRKGHFSEELYAGLSRNLPLLQTLVRKAPIDKLEIFDREELSRCLQMTALGIGKDTQGLARLSLALALLKWLTVQAAPRPTFARRPLVGPEDLPLVGDGRSRVNGRQVPHEPTAVAIN